MLAVPHLVWLDVWGLVALLATVPNWFATVLAGRSPDGLHAFLTAFLRYATHVSAYLALLAQPFPPFTGVQHRYPVDLDVGGPAPQNRWVTGFRLVLALPALLLALGLRAVLAIVAALGWFACLALGRMPEGLRDLGASCLRFDQRTHAYLLLLTDHYPSLSDR